MRLQLAEARDAWPVWTAVSLTFVAISAAVALIALVWSSGASAVESGLISDRESTGVTYVPLVNLVLAVPIAIATVSAAMSLVVQARRGALARLALVGATPGQVAMTLLWQLVAVTVTASIVGSAIAFALLRPALDLMLTERDVTVWIPAVYDVGLVAASVGVVVVLSLLGGLARAIQAGRIPPRDALRPPPPRPPRRPVARVVLAGLVALATVGVAASGIGVAPSLGSEGGTVLLQVSVAVIVLVGTVFALAAPVLVAPIARAWTSLIPVAGLWQLARHSVAARGARFASSVTPVMLAIGLTTGMVVVGAIITAAVLAREGAALEHAGVTSVLLIIGVPLAVALVGGVSAIIMMSRQRTAEIALVGIAGATVRERAMLPMLEGAIVAGTATILGAVMAAAGAAVIAIGLPGIGISYGGGVPIPWLDLSFTVAVCLLVVVAATTLPTLSALRLPEHRVVARLIAE